MKLTRRALISELRNRSTYPVSRFLIWAVVLLLYLAGILASQYYFSDFNGVLVTVVAIVLLAIPAFSLYEYFSMLADIADSLAYIGAKSELVTLTVKDSAGTQIGAILPEISPKPGDELEVDGAVYRVLALRHIKADKTQPDTKTAVIVEKLP